jgi:outer membrane protein assembly factor BamE (lipoprotein component of BamABCDE complex)
MNRKLMFGVFLVLLSALSYRAVDSTEYSPGYSEQAFNAVRDGMTEAEVRRLLGPPIRIHIADPGVIRWYGPAGSWVGADGGLHCAGSDWSNGHIIPFDPTGEVARENPWAGKTKDQISEMLGTPIKEEAQRSTVYWEYTRSDGNYHRRWVGFDPSGKVAETIAFFWWD